MYANVTNYTSNDNYEAKQETICGRSGRHTYTVYVERGAETGVAIPQRNSGFTLDMSKVAAAQAQAAQITDDLTGDDSFLNADKIAEAQTSVSWIMAQFGK